MIVFNLHCEAGHRFEGWFCSPADFPAAAGKAPVACPVCGSTQVQRALSAPRLNLGGEREPAADPRLDEQARALRRARELIARTEDVGERFAAEARRIHYREAPRRDIRGVASREEAVALLEEGIPVMPLPLRELAKETLQ